MDEETPELQQMGPPIDHISIESVVRACWARAVPSQTWDSLVRSAAKEKGISTNSLEWETCSALLRLLLECPQSPTTLSYIRHSIATPPLRTLLRPLIRPGYLARQVLLLSEDRSRPAVQELLFGELLDILQEGGTETAQKSYTAGTQGELLEGILAACSILVTTPTATLPSSSILEYIHLFLTKPPLKLDSHGVSKDVLGKTLATIDDSISSISDASLSEDTLVFGVKTCLSRLRSSLDQAPVEAVIVEIDLDASTSFPDPDITFLITDLVSQSASRFGISHTQTSVARLSTILKQRVSQSANRGSNTESALTSAFLEILLAATSELRKGTGNRAKNESFAFSRLPEVLRHLFAQPSFMDETLSDGFQASLESAVRTFCAIVRSPSAGGDAMDVDKPAGASVVNDLLAALCRQELISLDVGASLGDGLHPDDLMPQQEGDFCDRLLSEGDYAGLKELLTPLTLQFSAQRSMITGLQSAIESWSQNSDLSALTLVCRILVDIPQILEVVFIHFEPRHIFSPIRAFLEAFDTSPHDFGDAHPIESYGNIVLFLQIGLTRFNLYHDLASHLGTNKGFFVDWLPSTSAVYPLSALDDASNAAVGDWVGALLGEGISDELTQSTSPKVLLRTAPTICKQCFAACDAGVIDQPTLREGFSFFLQELLSFTLPGIITWIIEELERSSSSPMQLTLLDILKVFVFSDSLPPAVLELVSADLIKFHRRLKQSDLSSLDFERLTKLLTPLEPGTMEKLSPNTSWLEQLVADIEASVDLPSDASTSILSISLRNAQLDCPSQEIVSVVTERLFSLSRPLPTTFDEDSWLRAGRLVRVGEAIFSSPGSISPKSCPLLDYSTRHCLPGMLDSWARRPQDEVHLAAGVEVLGDVLAASFAASLQLAAELGSGGTETLLRSRLDQLAALVKRIRSTVSASTDESLVAGTLLDLFVKRISLVDSVAQGRCWMGSA